LLAGRGATESVRRQWQHSEAKHLEAAKHSHKAFIDEHCGTKTTDTFNVLERSSKGLGCLEYVAPKKRMKALIECLEHRKP
jgi:hypothetical protein